MKVKFKRIIICIFFILLLTCRKDNNNKNVSLNTETDLKAEQIKKAKNYGVVNVNRLRFRSDNDLRSKTLMYFDRGSIVVVIKKGDKRVRIEDVEDYWYQVEYDGIIGWVFGYYIDIYSSYVDAGLKSKEYSTEGSQNNSLSNVFYDEAIDNNLFFLSNGRILKVINGQNGNAKRLITQPGYSVMSYFFTNKTNRIYYIGKKKNSYDWNGSLYYYDLEKETNELVINNVYTATYNDKKNIIIVLSRQKSLNAKYWVIKILDVEDTENIIEVSKIEQKKEIENIENDMFSKTLERELGSLVDIKLDEKGNFIYFKPPEENLTYLISIKNGEYIQVETEKSIYFDIDASRYISIYSGEDENGESLYSIILKDKYSGMEKELISSQYYPINFSISPKKNLLAISMIDVNQLEDEYYFSGVFVLSLLNNSLMPISIEGKSYQPKWKKSLKR